MSYIVIFIQNRHFAHVYQAILCSCVHWYIISPNIKKKNPTQLAVGPDW